MFKDIVIMPSASVRRVVTLHDSDSLEKLASIEHLPSNVVDYISKIDKKSGLTYLLIHALGSGQI